MGKLCTPGIDATFTSALASSGVSVSGVTVARSGNEGILADLASAQPAVITGNTVTTAGLYGIHLVDAASPTVTGNTISCSGHQDSLNCPGARTRYPAIFLDGGSFDFTTIGTNRVPAGHYTLTISAEDFAHNIGTQEVGLAVVP